MRSAFRSAASACLLVLAALGGARPASADLLGIDVSNFQGVVNWAAVKSGGVSFGFAKATEGVDFVDARFATNMNNARLAGVPIGPYHFARIDSGVNPLSAPIKQDAINEANDFVDAIQPYYTSYPGLYLKPVLDIETLPSNAEINTVAEQKQYLSAWVRDFIGVVVDRLGVAPILYTNTNYARNYIEPDLAQYDLWLANWTYNTANRPSAVAGTTSDGAGVWSEYKFWQWSNSWSVGGLSPVDGDLFPGTTADLAQFLYPAAATPMTLPGDYNGDNIVNAADYTVWRDALLASGSGLPADGDGDGTIGLGDYAVWSSHYGDRLTGGRSVPEPAAFAVAAAALAVGWRRR